MSREKPEVSRPLFGVDPIMAESTEKARETRNILLVAGFDLVDTVKLRQQWDTWIEFGTVPAGSKIDAGRFGRSIAPHADFVIVGESEKSALDTKLSKIPGVVLDSAGAVAAADAAVDPLEEAKK